MPTVDPIGSTTLSDAYSPYPKIAQLKDVASFRAHLAQLEIDLPVDERIFRAVQGSVLADPIAIGGRMLGNRWCIQPMEGWDAQPDGSPSEHTIRRWRNFGASGAKLIWGGEAAAVSPEARANPNQLLAVQANRDGLKRLLDQLLSAHQEAFGRVDDLLVGLQLTHSGRFCCPQEKNRAEPRIAYHHPLLDAKFGVDSSDSAAVLSDDELLRLIDRYLAAARLARDVGFHFVDIKACHGYLVHELLSARRRPGPFGGEYEGRTKFLLTIVERIRDELPDLVVGVRLSVFDTPPFRTSRQVGRAMPYEDLLPYEYGFGVNARDPMQCDLEEPIWLIRDLKRRGVGLVNLTCGSPYYNPIFL